MRDANVPKRFVGLTLDRFKGDKPLMAKLLRFIAKLRDFDMDGFGFYIYAGKGVGKTAMGVQLLLHALYYGHSAYYISLDDLVDLCMGETSDSGVSFHRLSSAVSVLCVDNISAENAQDRKAGYYRVLHRLMQSRADAGLPTILIATGLSPKDFEHHFGSSAYSLLTRYYSALKINRSETVERTEAERLKERAMVGESL